MRRRRLLFCRLLRSLGSVPGRQDRPGLPPRGGHAEHQSDVDIDAFANELSNCRDTGRCRWHLIITLGRSTAADQSQASSIVGLRLLR